MNEILNEMSGCYTRNSADVTAKVIDGELIIIRLSDGTYYSMENVGTHIWELIEMQYDLSTVARTLAGWYGVPVARAEADVAKLVRQLVEEGLTIPAPGGPASESVEAPAGLLPYESPTLNIYRDMGNLLALDPPTPGIDDLLFGNGRDQ